MTVQIAVYGRLARDPVEIQTKTGTAMAASTLAVNVPDREQETGESTMTDPPARPDKSISDIRRMTKGKAGVEPRDGETMLEAITRHRKESEAKQGAASNQPATGNPTRPDRPAGNPKRDSKPGKPATGKRKTRGKPEAVAEQEPRSVQQRNAAARQVTRRNLEYVADYALTVPDWWHSKESWQAIIDLIKPEIGAVEICRILDNMTDGDEPGLSLLARVVERLPERVEGDQRDRKILPREMAGGVYRDGAPAHIFRPLNDNAIDQLAIGADGTGRGGKQLSLIQDNAPDELIPDCPGLMLADHAGLNTPQRGRGERIDKRLLYYLTTVIPQDERRPGGRYTLTPTLDEIARGLIWPRNDKGRSSWQPHRDALPLYRAMEAVTLAGVVLPDGRVWRPVMFRATPNFYDLTSRAQIEIRFPDDTPTGGAMIDWQGLVEAGSISGPAFDGAVTLATLWDKVKSENGGYRIYATRPAVLRDDQGFITRADGQRIIQHGQPVKDWRHPQAVRVGIERHPQADKVPLLDRDDRRRLFYGKKSDGGTKQVRSNQATKADQRLIELEKQGRVVIEREGDKWRVLEPRPRR